MRSPAYNNFYRSFKRLEKFRKTALIASELIRSAGSLLILLALYLAADYFLAFPGEALLFLDCLLGLFISAAFTARALKIVMTSKAKTAALLDDAAKNKRRSILSAYELEKLLFRSGTGEDSFREYLISKTAEDANRVMSKLTVKEILPLLLLKKMGFRFLISLAVFVVIALLNSGASKIILTRIFCPLKDIPPYSRYVFDVNPACPEVLYGDNLELSARIKGAPLKSQVWFCTRDAGKIRRTACFREGPDCFAQKIEKVTVPVEFCFATGRARSQWHKVKILFQPKVMLAKILITPPAYSRLPQHSFVAGTEDIKALKGSELELSIISNRPLSGGRLTVKPENGDESTSINGEKHSSNTVVFHWKLNSPAKLEADILDHIGTKSDKPLILKQSITEDLLPELSISEPGPFMLATPGVKISLRGTVKDDIGLKKIELVKALFGYHDRIAMLGTPDYSREENVALDIDLAKLGVEPGQTLEFYIEAFDVNPELTGVAASDILKVQIISEADYAEYLRNYIKLENIIASYRELSGEFEKLRKLSFDFQNALAKGGLSAEEKRRFIDDMRKSNENAEKFFRRFAEDFPIYDMEKEQKETFKDILSRIITNSGIIGEMNPEDEDDLKKRVAQICASLAEKQTAMQKIDNSFDKFEALALLMSDTALFKQLVMEQGSLVRRLNRFATAQTERSAMLETIAVKQREILEHSLELIKNIGIHAEKLQPEFWKLKKDSLAFAASLERLMIADFMKSAMEAAKNQNGPGAYKNAIEAYRRMLLLSGEEKDQDSFRDMMDGKIGFSIGDEMRSTAKEMLKAINKQINGGNSGSDGKTESGQFSGGQSGYSTTSNSLLNVPVKGPQRSTPENKRHLQGKGNGKAETGKGGAGTTVIDKNSSEKISLPMKKKTEGANTLPVDEVPEKYRDAVKKYFGD